MKEKELNIVLRERARELGLCDQWYNDWDKESTKQELIDKYLKGIDFCIKHNYPKPAFIKEHFEEKLLLKNNIFLDNTINDSNLSKVVLLGESKGALRYNGVHTGDVYVRHNSNLTIEVTDVAKVFVEAYENCNIRIVAIGDSKVFVYWHGGTIEYEGNVTIRDKRKAGE